MIKNLPGQLALFDNFFPDTKTFAFDEDGDLCRVHIWFTWKNGGEGGSL